jgi:hypothetical protein
VSHYSHICVRILTLISPHMDSTGVCTWSRRVEKSTKSLTTPASVSTSQHHRFSFSFVAVTPTTRAETPEPFTQEGRRNLGTSVQLLDNKGSVSTKVRHLTLSFPPAYALQAV